MDGKKQVTEIEHSETGKDNTLTASWELDTAQFEIKTTPVLEPEFYQGEKQ